MLERALDPRFASRASYAELTNARSSGPDSNDPGWLYKRKS